MCLIFRSRARAENRDSEREENLSVCEERLEFRGQLCGQSVTLNRN